MRDQSCGQDIRMSKRKKSSRKLILIATPERSGFSSEALVVV